MHMYRFHNHFLITQLQVHNLSLSTFYVLNSQPIQLHCIAFVTPLFHVYNRA